MIKRIVILTAALVSGMAFGQVEGRQQVMSNLAKVGMPSYFVNPACAQNDTTGITDANNIVARVASGGLGDLGTDCQIDASASGQKAVFAWRTYPNRLEIGNCEVIGYLKGDASLYKVNVVQNSVVLNSLQLFNSPNGQEYSIQFPCGSDNSQAITVEIEATDNAAAVFNHVFLHGGEWDGVGKGQEVAVVFDAARSANQSIATDTPTTVLWDTVTHNSGGVFSSGVLTVDKFGDYQICATTRLADASGWAAGELFSLRAVHESNEKYLARYSYDTSSSGSPTLSGCATFTGVEVGDDLFVRVYQNNGNSINLINNAAFNTIFILYISPENSYTRINARGSEWTAYTPTITYTSGGMTNVTHDFKYKCIDSKTLAVEGTTTFTGISAAYNTPRYSLPSGAVYNGTQNNWSGYARSGSFSGNTSAEVSDGRLVPTKYNISGTDADTVGITNSMAGTNGDFIEFGHFNIQIEAGFCPNPVAPRVAQGQVSGNKSGTNITRIGRISCSSPSAISTAFPNEEPWLASISNASSGKCDVGFVAGAFSSSDYVCTLQAYAGPSTAVRTAYTSNKSQSGFTLTQSQVTTGGASALATGAWDITCTGPIN